MGRADRLSAGRFARRRVPPLGACLNFRRHPRTRPRGPPRAAPGPPLGADLPAQPRRRTERRAKRGTERMTAPADQQRLLEALLFAAPAPLFEAELAERLGVEADIAGLLHELAARYGRTAVK